jgi:hypothetical protein
MNLIEFDITSSLQFFEGLVFGKIFVSFISVCFNNTWIAPLVNECPSPFFKISRGFWKGSPLSLILCILIAEALSQRLSVEEREIMLVVEPDYLPDSEVLAFSRVYTP